jgi:very-short-patch-repair endonuclease
MAAVLRGGPTALASHLSGAGLWQLDGTHEGPIHVSLKSDRAIDRVVVHRRGRTDDPEVVTIDGIPVTAIDRTLLDLAAVASSQRVGLALDDALRRRLTGLERLQTFLAGRKGRAGTRVLRKLLQVRDHKDARVESRLESSLLRLLRNQRIPIPLAQYTVLSGDEFVARLDFAYPEGRIALEADGYRWHSSPEQWRRDIRRENQLKLLGWTVLRFSWEDVHDRPQLVTNQIREALRMSEVFRLLYRFGR